MTLICVEDFYNHSGLIRLREVRHDYLGGSLSFDDVIRVHALWVSQNEYVVVGSPLDASPPPPPFHCGVWHFDYEYWAFKMAKRGNDGHKARLKNKFSPLIDTCSHNKAFRFIPDGSVRGRTPALMLTLTYDTSLCSMDDSWLNVGSELNLFLSNVRRHYGDISVLRSFESFSNGFVHVHLVILFHSHSFSCSRYLNAKSGKFEYLVPLSDKDFLSDSWHSFVKVSGVASLGGVMYVAKYIFSGVFGEKSKRSLVSCWLFGRRQYGLSKDFVEVLGGYIPNFDTSLLDSLMHNSNSNLGKHGFVAYAGVKKLPVDCDSAVFKLKPPPDIDFPADVYDTHDAWLRDFVVSDAICSLCGIPVFFDEFSDSHLIEDCGRDLIVCNSCYGGFSDV